MPARTDSLPRPSLYGTRPLPRSVPGQRLPPPTFCRSEDLVRGFASTVAEFASARQGLSICEVGGGRSPLLSPDLFAKQRSRSTVLDISPTELAHLPPTYDRVQADICDPRLPIEATYDLVFSRMLAEHVADGQRFHSNVLAC